MSRPFRPDDRAASPLAGEIVVFAGKLSSLGLDEAHALVHELGGTPAADISEETTLVVVGGEPTSGAAGRRTVDMEEDRNRGVSSGVAPVSRGASARVIAEDEFCRIAGLPPPDAPVRGYYALRDIRSMYPGIRDDHVRYLQKWGLIGPGRRTGGGLCYPFSDLALIKYVHAELARGTAFRTVLRTLAANRSGQLSFDFRSTRETPAKVLTLPPARPDRPLQRMPEGQAAISAARHFLEGASLDDGDEMTQRRAEEAYRRALVLDPFLVAALVNLANIHYGRDELIEAQVLYERAIGIDAECFEAHFNLGNVYHDLGRYLEAEACYMDALALRPAYADAHFYLAVTLEKQGRSQDARPHWRTYRQLAPNGEWVELAKEFSE